MNYVVTLIVRCFRPSSALFVQARLIWAAQAMQRVRTVVRLHGDDGDEDDDGVVHVANDNKTLECEGVRYTFDALFGPSSSTTELFATVRERCRALRPGFGPDIPMDLI